MRAAIRCGTRTAPWLVLALLAAGCGEGDGLERATVSGKVTLDGKPLAKGHIQFIPKAGDSRGAAWGQVVDGSYAIPAADGPAAGPYDVSITPDLATSDAAGSTEEAPGEPPAEAESPPTVAYTAAAPMEATISPAGSNTFNFEITTTKAPRRGRR